MIRLKRFENKEEQAEYIFVTSTQWIGTEHEEPLYDFTEEDFEDYKNYGYVYDIYYEKAIELHGLEWELDEENGILLTSTYVGSEEEIDAEGYTENDYEELKDLAVQAQGIEFEIIENPDHPDYEMKKQSKKFGL